MKDDYSIDYVDESNIYAYKIINKEYRCILKIVKFNNFGLLLENIFE